MLSGITIEHIVAHVHIQNSLAELQLIARLNTNENKTSSCYLEVCYFACNTCTHSWQYVFDLGTKYLIFKDDVFDEFLTL